VTRRFVLRWSWRGRPSAQKACKLIDEVLDLAGGREPLNGNTLKDWTLIQAHLQKTAASIEEAIVLYQGG
jgi:hypothetical protein